jgi:hypothetical protein
MQKDMNELLIDSMVETNIENSVPVYFDFFEWDILKKYWRPEGSTGDM